MTAELSTGIRASRYRVPRTRGATSGALLLVLGAWAALVPFIGPYLNLAYTPQPNNSWYWTSARGWLEVAPGAAAFAGGLLLLMSASRLVTMFGGWLAAAGGAWLIVGPPLAAELNVNLGTPDPASGTGTQAAETLFFFYATGAAILLVASVAIGRLSTRTLRDIQAAERRIAEEDSTDETAVEPAQEPAQEPAMAGAGRHAGAAGPGYPTTAYPSAQRGTYAEPTYSSAPPPPESREAQSEPPTTP